MSSASSQTGKQLLRGARGFTLVELIVAVAVIAIVAAIAVPSMTSIVNSARLRGTTSELTAAMQLARSEASRRNARVSVCATSDGTSCVSSTTWTRWLVSGRDNAASAASGTEVLDVIRDYQGSPAVQVTGPAQPVVFLPSGRTTTVRTISVCKQGSQRVITVLMSGSLTTQQNSGSCP